MITHAFIYFYYYYFFQSVCIKELQAFEIQIMKSLLYNYYCFFLLFHATVYIDVEKNYPILELVYCVLIIFCSNGIHFMSTVNESHRGIRPYYPNLEGCRPVSVYHLVGNCPVSISNSTGLFLIIRAAQHSWHWEVPHWIHPSTHDVPIQPQLYVPVFSYEFVCYMPVIWQVCILWV